MRVTLSKYYKISWNYIILSFSETIGPTASYLIIFNKTFNVYRHYLITQ